MSDNDTHYPQFPSGFWRRILLQPGPGWIGGALEDDFHRFTVRIEHREGRITGVAARALRHPWTGCAASAPHLASEIEGELLSELAGRDPQQHCTHLFDLAIVLAAHAGDEDATYFDMQIADKIDKRTTAKLCVNGDEQLLWHVNDTIITGPDKRFTGRNLRKLSSWKQDFRPQEAEWCTMLRRANYVSGGRLYTPATRATAADSPLAALRPCFNYQPSQIDRSRPCSDRRNFAPGELEPLQELDPTQEFGELV